MEKIYDVAIIGGGINGCGVAADAATRGLSVFLCEQDDLASKTSSSSTKLIHGGLRYLELLDFKMVKKALDERQLLLELAPHLVQPLGLVLPHFKKMRPLWILRLGLFLYDHLSFKNKLPKSRLVNRHKDAVYFTPLIQAIKKGFLYYDCSTNDARLTIVNAIQAHEHGAKICTRTKLVNACTQDNLWILTLKHSNGQTDMIKAKSLINAAGPWVKEINQITSIPQIHPMTLVKGSHLVIEKLYEGEHAYLLQHSDKRVVFVIPYFNHTMIGTTDIEHHDLSCIEVSDEEIDYLLGLINQYFNQTINRDQIKDQWSGVRPLLEDNGKSAKALSRDYTFEYTDSPAPAITIYGGKITTYRQLAEEVVDELKPLFPQMRNSLTHQLPLPGAEIGAISLNTYRMQAKETFSWLGEKLLNRYLALYGTRTQMILNGKQNKSDLGLQFSDEFYQAELDYLIELEWARTLDDVLLRRTKLGLSLDTASQGKIKKYLRQHPAILESVEDNKN